MAEIIQDGRGTGNTAKVDSLGKVHADAVSTFKEDSQARRGLAYNINTGTITLTNASTANGVLYLKNNEDYDLIISNIAYILGNSTGGTGDILVEVIKNPTTGTLISGASTVETSSNKNFGNSRLLNALVYKGATGNTVTDGSTFAKTILGTGAQRIIGVLGGSIILPRGSSIAIRFTTPASNTSMNVQFAFACYLEDISI